jgi:vacuolar-type H+-ATPase subunit H/membrane protein implicated in regulation of membrane protease activity
METKKGEEVKRKVGADSGYVLKPAQQKGEQIIEQARKQANDEATEILNMVEENGRLMISEAVKVAEAEAARLLGQAQQEAREIVAKAREQAQSFESRAIPQNGEQIGQAAREAKNVVIESQLGTTMTQAVDTGFSIVVEATKKAETEANMIIAQAKETGRQIIEEATRKREGEANKIVSQAQETGRQIIEEATRKAEDEGNKIVTQALQTGLQIIVEAAKIADTEAEIPKRISQGEPKERRFIEEAKAAAVNRLSTDGKYPDVEREFQQLTKETKDAEVAKTAAATSPSQTPKSILKPAKEETSSEMKARLIITIFTNLVYQAIIVAVIIWGLPRWGVNIPLYCLILICVAVAVYGVGSFLIGNRTLRRKPLPGLTTMVGIEGQVASRLAPEGFVRIGGELWNARAEDGSIDVGADVIVVRQSRLKVVVCRKQADNSRKPETESQFPHI